MWTHACFWEETGEKTSRNNGWVHFLRYYQHDSIDGDDGDGDDIHKRANEPV